MKEMTGKALYWKYQRLERTVSLCVHRGSRAEIIRGDSREDYSANADGSGQLSSVWLDSKTFFKAVRKPPCLQ